MDRLNHEALNDGTDDEADQRRDNETDPEIPGHRQAEPRQHGADHEEVAVRNVDDIEKTEDHRKAERDQRNDQPPDQPVHRQQEDRVSHNRPQFMAAPEILFRQFPTFGTSTQERTPAGADPAGAFRLHNISTSTASEHESP